MSPWEKSSPDRERPCRFRLRRRDRNPIFLCESIVDLFRKNCVGLLFLLKQLELNLYILLSFVCCSKEDYDALSLLIASLFFSFRLSLSFSDLIRVTMK